MCCSHSSVCVSAWVCTSVMCCNGVGGERHTDSKDPSWWQRQTLPPDEQRSDWWERDITLSSSLYFLAHFHSIALFSLSIYSLPHSVPPSLSLLSLSFRGCQSVFSLSPPSLSSYSPPSFSSCQMFFHSPFQSISLFPVSFYSLAIFVCMSVPI